MIPEQKRGVFKGPQHSTQDPTRRRESKIAQYKMEKEIKGKLEVRSLPSSQSALISSRTNIPSLPFQELRLRRLSRRPSSSTPAQPSSEEADDDDLNYDSDSASSEIERPLLLNLLLLHYITAHSEISSIAQEVELLQSGMAMSDLESGPPGIREEGAREREREDEGSWRVEDLKALRGEGPLLDPKGRVRRNCSFLRHLPPTHHSN